MSTTVQTAEIKSIKLPVLTNDAPVADQTRTSKLFLPPSCTPSSTRPSPHQPPRAVPQNSEKREMLLRATRKFGAEASKCQRNNEQRTSKRRTKREPLVNVQTVHRTAAPESAVYCMPLVRLLAGEEGSDTDARGSVREPDNPFRHTVAHGTSAHHHVRRTCAR
jgi:hypothetical protein